MNVNLPVASVTGRLTFIMGIVLWCRMTDEAVFGDRRHR